MSYVCMYKFDFVCTYVGVVYYCSIVGTYVVHVEYCVLYCT